MSFGREAMRKTLKQLKESATMQFSLLNNEIKNTNTRMEIVGKTLTDAKGKSFKEVVNALGEAASEYLRIMRVSSNTFLTTLISLVSYISALENYSLEFDETWDALVKRTEKAMKQVEDTTEKLEEKDLSYIK